MQTQTYIKQPTDAKILRHWLDYSVPRGEYDKLRSRLMEACLISRATFNNWLYGKCRIPDSGKRDINRVTKDYSGTEIFTIAKPGASIDGVSDVASGKAI